MCGEQLALDYDGQVFTGSSPRVRGTVRQALARPTQNRFIPACAGNSRHSLIVNFSTSVHPRVCGEQWSCNWIAESCLGSSPRVRGTGLMESTFRPCLRFIPACAGNRFVPPAIRHPAAVHPRVCGEQETAGFFIIPHTGSSPRVRGTDFNGGSVPSAGRFIPACAGNSPRASPLHKSKSVHPRVCGEQPYFTAYYNPVRGSSPRVRGTELTPGCDAVTNRFIPACAGNRLKPG